MTRIDTKYRQAGVIMLNRDERSELTKIAERFVSTFVVFGRHEKHVPKDIKALWLDLLPRLMVDAYLLQHYCTIVRMERQKRSVHELLLMLPGEELPIEEIAKDGFARIDDAVLADLALCPEALTTLRNELFDNPELDVLKGTWFHAAEQETFRTKNQLPAASIVTKSVTSLAKSRTSWWRIATVALVITIVASIATRLIVFRQFSAQSIPSDNSGIRNPAVVPEEKSRPLHSRDSIVSTPVGSLPVKINEFRMMNSSHPETPYSLKITTDKPVFLMHLFTWTSDSVPLHFSWHGENYAPQIPAGMTEVLYPNDLEKRKFQGFSGFLLVFTSQKVPVDFWTRFEGIPSGQRSSVYIDRTRDLVLTELGKIGIPPESVFIFAAVETTIQKQ
jgi:hypothetical protein